MDPTALATSLISMQAQKIQTQAGMAVLKKTFDMQKQAMDMLLPVKAALPSGVGTQVDKTA
jgi:invasion protein IalB